MDTKSDINTQYLINAVVQQRDAALNQLAQATAANSALLDEVRKLRKELQDRPPQEVDEDAAVD